MRNNRSLTAAQAEEEMKYYRKVFDVVRILRRNEIAGICAKENTPILNCPCYSFWGKPDPCENCTSAKAIETKRDQVKLEFRQDEIFHVISRYIEVDGEPCVMELLHEVEPENIIDMSGEEKLLSRINEYYEKTYTDVLTGIYNRRFYEEKLKKSVISAGIAMIDLDDFKIYNDVYGHIAGDAVLNAFATELKNNIRTSDHLIRYEIGRAHV